MYARGDTVSPEKKQKKCTKFSSRLSSTSALRRLPGGDK